MLQDLCELPKHLQQAVLASSRVLLAQGVQLLPEPLLEAAIHALNPSIAASATLHVPASQPRGIGEHNYFQVIGEIVWLRELHVDLSSTLDGTAVHSIANLTQLRSLIIRSDSRWCHKTGQDANIFNDVLQRLTSLQHLDYSTSSIACSEAASLARAISQLTILSRLCLTAGFFDHVGVLKIVSVLPSLPHLQVCDISELDCCAGRDLSLGENIGSHLNDCRSLQELHVNTSGGAEQIFTERFVLTCLRKLGVCGVKWSRAFHNALQQLSSLRSLKIDCTNGLQDRPLPLLLPSQLLADCVGNLCALDELDIQYSPDDDARESIRGLSVYITKLNRLTSLSLKGARLMYDGGCTVAYLVSRCTDLRVCHILEVDEARTQVGLVGVANPLLAESFSTILSVATLKELVLSKYMPLLMFGQTIPTDENLIRGGAASLTTLKLHMHDRSRQSAFVFGRILEVPTMHALLHLDLGNNTFQYTGGLHLAECIGAMTSLRVLSLYNVQIQCLAWRAVASQLSKLQCLQELDARLASPTDYIAASVLPEMLGSLNSLHYLYLKSDWLEGEGADLLGAEIARLTNLEELSFGGRLQNSAAVKRLAPYIVHIRSLRMVDLDGARESETEYDF